MTKKTIALACALLLCAMTLNGCGGTGAQSPAPTAPASTESDAPRSEPVTTASPTPTAAPATASPEPTPSPKPQGVYSDDVYAYFQRVGFGGKANGAPAIAKWAEPIRIQVLGNPGGGDGKALGGLIQALKAICGMPEITFVTEGGNFVIGYMPKSKGREVDENYDDAAYSHIAVNLGEGGPSARIFIADEMIVQEERDACLATAVFEALGLSADPEGEYPDSVLNPGAGAVAPSGRDWLMLRLLYSPGLKAGLPQDGAMPGVMALNPDQAPAPAPGRDEQLEYFNEVGFYYGQSLRNGVVSKWASPIQLQIEGAPAADQQALLDGYIAKLNEIEGFPGIALAQSGGNFIISFDTRDVISNSFPGMANAEACAWKPVRGKGNAITGCSIGVTSDFADAAEAQSQFLRVFIWALGLNFTSGTQPSSILNLDAHAQDWSEMDWAMLRLLYRADVECGAKRTEVMNMLGEELK